MLADYQISSNHDAEGDYAWIHFARRKHDNTDVAIKFNKQSDDDSLARFRLENKILRELADSKYVINVLTEVLYGYRYPRQQKHYYVMEKADYNLDTWLSVFADTLSDAQKFHVMDSIISGIGDIQNKGYIHRDLHTENVLIKNIQPDVLALLTDFGRAYDLSSKVSKSKIDKPAWGQLFLPPEVSFGLISHDDPLYGNGDIYAFGLLTKQMFTLGVDVQIMLMKMHDSIKAFKRSKLKNGELPENYIKLRQLKERMEDYYEWCMIEESDNKDRYDIDHMNENLKTLIKVTSRINYMERVSDVKAVVEILQGLRS